MAEGLSSVPFETKPSPDPADCQLRWASLCDIYHSSAECFELPEAPDGATALGGLLWSGWLGLAGWFEDVSNLLQSSCLMYSLDDIYFLTEVLPFAPNSRGAR